MTQLVTFTLTRNKGQHMTFLLSLLLFSQIELSQSHFTINGKPTLLRSGSLQWYRLPKTEWQDRLDKFKAIGYNTVEMYVSWQYIEPLQNEFHLDDMRDFLQMCKEHGLYVYFRPGPYICNEENGGGIPSWVIGKSEKHINPDSLDGKYAVRTDDLDYMQIVKIYFEKVNSIVKDYQLTTGGTVILYQIENEYNYFESSVKVDTYAMYNNKQERPFNTTLNTYNVMYLLREMVKEQGITIPITHCPGNYELGGMGGIEEVLPLPNFYGSWKNIEYLTYKYKIFQSKIVNYHKYPSGISETFRSATMYSRMILAGMDLVSHFNAFGMYQKGHHNSQILQLPGVMNPKDLPKALNQIVHFSYKDLFNGFVKPPMAMFPSVVDYNGAVSASGQLRDKFFQIRRLTTMYESFEHIIAPANAPFRTISGKKHRKLSKKIEGASDIVFIDSPDLGSKDPDAKGGKVIYWLPLANQTCFIGLLNDGSKGDIIVKPNSISVYNLKFPVKTNFVVPQEQVRTIQLKDGSVNGNAEFFYMFHLMVNLPIGHLKLLYSTAEVLLHKEYQGKSVLMLYNKEQTPYEFQIEISKSIQLDKAKMEFEIVESKADTLIILVHGIVPNQGDKPILYHIGDTDVIVFGRFLSARVYHIEKLSFLIGVDIYNPRTNQISFVDHSRFFWSYQLELKFKKLYQDNLLHQYAVPNDGISLQEIDLSKTQFNINLDSTNFDFKEYSAPLESSESLGIYNDYVHYKANFKLEKIKKISIELDSVADFATVFVNGHHVASLCPLGTKIESSSWNPHYGFKIDKTFLKMGLNELYVRVDIWGRGNFMVLVFSFSFPEDHSGEFQYLIISFRLEFILGTL
eukprot:NODE_179_length_13932_cov_0.652064.p1 type:complete len:854 gc:universal NODE_179_length_13932_cov_0.652064:10454-7893(-)